ncbi:hypothetical protein PSACC_00586 [Paramicrosporidium saccamoebae]|uniref:Uncharacterized protein n=1 Tax=Paramicrosporidium saccamoebae TaxID=1246581 RepID=A0A2H9TP99_9FUNG|nr:hypothetical protein PSACC_00586 [Paramicrosporidium saccamoebae]
MFAAYVVVAFSLTCAASNSSIPLGSSEPFEEYFGLVSNLEKQVLSPASPRNGSRFEESLFPHTHVQSTLSGKNSFSECSYSNQHTIVGLGDAEPHPKTADTQSSRPDSEEPYRAKIVERQLWFTRNRRGVHDCTSSEFTCGAIQRVTGFGQYFRSRSLGLTTWTNSFGSLMERNIMIFSGQLKCGLVGKGMEALKDQGFFGSERLLKVEKSANNTLAVVLAGKRIVIHSFGTPALAAVLLRVKEDRYESIMISEDNMSVEGTLKSKDIIVVGVCHVIWGGLSLSVGSSLEDITTDIAEQLPYGMAVAAIVR